MPNIFSFRFFYFLSAFSSIHFHPVSKQLFLFYNIPSFITMNILSKSVERGGVFFSSSFLHEKSKK